MKSLSACGFVIAASALAGSLNAATTYYWCGSAESNVLDKANWYLDQDKKQPAEALPGAGDVISACYNGPETITFDDDSIAMLSQVSRVQPRYGYTVIDISTNADVTAAIRNWGTSTVVKRGKGSLYLKATGSGSDNSSYLESWRVEAGEVYTPTNAAKATYWLGKVDVWEGARFWLYPGEATTRASKGICGAGTIAKEKTSGKTGPFYVDGSNTKPFSGYLTGNLQLYPCGKCYITGVTNDFPCGIYYYGGTLGFVKYSGKTGSSLGAGASRSQTYNNNFTVLCLATQSQTTADCSIWDWTSPTLGSGRITHDAGAYGGVTYAPGTTWDSVFNGYKELVLTGSNTVACVFRAAMTEKNSCTGRYYLTKRGTGTWVMGNKYANSTSLENRPILAGVGVENGTLKFESIAEAGTDSSLGLGTACLGYAYKGPAKSAPAEADYAIRLGSTNLAENGIFQYSGTVNVLCTTRPIAVVGNGTLANGTDKVFRWSNAKALGTLPEGGEKPAANSLTLADNGVNSTKNVLTGLKEETGAAPTKVVKTGAGRWTLDGELTFTGGVDVREGTLEIANCNYYNWFRVTFMDNYVGFYPDYELPADNWTKIYLMIGEIGLFDAAGNRVNLGLTKGDNYLPTATRPTLNPGQAAFGYSSGNDHTTQKLVNSFDGDGATGTYMNRGKVVSHTNEESWVSVVMHLPHRVGKVASFDYQYYLSMNAAYTPPSPKSAKIEGSLDGLTWYTITNASEIATSKGSSKWSISGQAFTGASDVVTGGMALDTAHAGPTVLPNGLSSVKVAAGATLDILGSPIAIKKLEIAAAGMGTLRNGSFATSGVIELSDLPAGSRIINIPATFEDCENVARLADWTVQIGGRTRQIDVVPTETGLRVIRRGISYIVR